jgi:uncharacterized membrane protein YebE (DUF533 family)
MLQMPDIGQKRRRRLRIAAISLGSAAMLGSFGGVALANYTVSGMNPFYFHPSAPAYAVAHDERHAEDWSQQFAERVDEDWRPGSARDQFVDASYTRY